jgi:hypothetical protein
MAGMRSHPVQQPMATLWRLARNDDEIRCAVYRHGAGLELRLESPHTVILTEPFEFQPRMIARTDALRASLARRGWHEVRR